MVKTNIGGQTPHQAWPVGPKSGPRILVLFSDIGEGHASAARTLRDEIQAEDPSAEVVLENGFEALGPFLRWFMRDFYRRQHASVPWLYRLSYEIFRRVWMFRALGALILVVLGGRGERRLVEGYSPDVVISTDARLNAVLGYLKRLGRLKMPVFATLTDLGGLEFWTHKGVDLHLVMDATCVAPVERLAGKGAARHVRPLVAPAFFSPFAQEEARAALGLPLDGKTVLVSGGGWGMGDMEGAIRAVLAVPGAHAVCIAGRNVQSHAALQAGFLGDSRVTVLGFTSQMNELLAACDVVVHAMGGVTYLEATVRGRPVVAYKPPTGHPALIAQTLEKQGRQQVAWTQEQLTAELREAFVRPHVAAVATAQLPSPASAIREAPLRVRPRPWWQTAALRVSLVAVFLALVGSFAFFADASYPVVAKTLRLQAAKAATQPAAVQLVIRARPESVAGILAELQAYQATASFALLSGWSSYQVQAVTAAQSQVLADLAPGSPMGWVHTRRTLQEETVGAGIAATRVYLPPKDGLTLAEYLLARSVRAVPLSHVTWVRSTDVLRGSFRAGSVVVLDLDSSAAAAPILDGLLERLDQEGLVAVPLALQAFADGSQAGEG
jgi:UDP-N-acetylglucosamine:LPS N-acetylglucosamine transferase